MDHLKNAINLDHVDVLQGDAREIARLWVTHRGPATVFLNTSHLADPAMIGMLLVDTARHAARAYAQSRGMDEEEAMERIWQGFDAERGAPSSELRAPDGEDSQH